MTTTTEKLYADRDIEAQGENYMRHLNALTFERLHDKGAIAAELAHRDIQIAVLLAAAVEAESMLAALCVHGPTAVPWTGIARLRAAIAAVEGK